MQLAAQVAAEQNPKKFRALLAELKQLLDEKESRFANADDSPPEKPK
jgi:hypothetical protein